MFELKEKVTITHLFEVYSDDILRYALSILRNLEESKDTVQEVFLKFQLHEVNYKGECNYKTWLFTITRNICFNKLKNRQIKKGVYEDLKFQPKGNISLDDLISLKQALKRLTAEENELIFLRDFENYSYKELAEILDISIDNVKVRLFRVKKKLRKYLEE